ncbi:MULTISPECIES: DUF421 domain-containing protein [unclassified Clostridium]|uniref:DUF421 domain-containing protein n=1 Tax=unclassified Clostridium TaxID=2614128 RepID=UPI0025B9D4C5|nr:MULTISPECIES: DUF421 domain-containing protein [unclassified Clostridium]
MGVSFMEVLILLLKTTLSFLSLLILTRMLGKKQMSQLSFFNYVTGITIGSIVANIITVDNEPFIDEIIGLAWWCILAEATAYITVKSHKLGRLLDGEPSIVIKDGKIIRKVVVDLRMNVEDLTMMLREQSIFSVSEVDYAVIEPNGKLSVLKKHDYQEVTKEDMKIKPTPKKYLPTQLISDGSIVEHNLKEVDVTKKWLEKQLKNSGVKSIDEVYYAEIQSDGTLFVNKKD